jgi:SAM-dependent methyltransferase
MPFESVTACNICASEKLRSLDPPAHLVLCEDCGYVFVSPRPDFQELQNYYSKASKYDGWLSELEARDLLWKRRLKKIKGIKRSGNLLDVGTGIGQFLHHARKEFTDVEGLEISSSAIQIAREKYRLDIRRGTIENLDFDKKYDHITLFHVLEHVHDPKSVLEKCRSLLTDDGLLVIAAPNDLKSWELKIRTLMRRRRGELGSSFGKYGIPALALDGTVDEIHLSQFTAGSLCSALTRLGFRIVDRSLDPYFATTGKKLFIQQAYLAFHSLLNRLFGVNFYNTIWIVASK